MKIAEEGVKSFIIDVHRFGDYVCAAEGASGDTIVSTSTAGKVGTCLGKRCSSLTAIKISPARPRPGFAGELSELGTFTKSDE